MLCQNCGKYEATTHVKRVVNGDTTEMHLCSKCAAHLGYGDIFSGFGLNLDDFFGGFLGDTAAQLTAGNQKRCEKCGSTFEDIIKSGKLGCADCYRTFYDELLPSLQRIHGRIKHSGKKALNNIEAVEEKAEPKKENDLSSLKAELEQAVKEQNFEQAAVLRDKIKELEK